MFSNCCENDDTMSQTASISPAPTPVGKHMCEYRPEDLVSGEEYIIYAPHNRCVGLDGDQILYGTFIRNNWFHPEDGYRGERATLEGLYANMTEISRAFVDSYSNGNDELRERYLRDLLVGMRNSRVIYLKFRPLNFANSSVVLEQQNTLAGNWIMVNTQHPKWRFFQSTYTYKNAAAAAAEE